MISATLYFDNGVNVGDLIDKLGQLPSSKKPIYFSENEAKVAKSNLISNSSLFSKFIENNELGFFLHSEDKSIFDISTHSVRNASLTVYLHGKATSDAVESIFKCLSQVKPIFGFACDEDEYKYKYRNRYYITIGQNHIEDWVGRKLDKYLSGVYWYTLLSEKLLKEHGINVTDLSAEAVLCESMESGSLHLLKFYEDVSDWRENADRLDNLCEKTKGVFSRRSVELAVRGATNYMEYDDIIADWR